MNAFILVRLRVTSIPNFRLSETPIFRFQPCSWLNLLNSLKGIQKIETDELVEENLEKKPYLANLRLDQARVKFK